MTIQGGKEMNKLLKISMPALLILGLMLGTGCAAEGPEAVMAPPPQAEDAASKTEQYRGGEGQAYEADIERKIVKTGYLTLEVDDTVEAMNGVAALAK